MGYFFWEELDRLNLLIQEEAALLRSQFVLKGKVRVRSGKDQEFYIREGQFLLFNAEAPDSDLYIENEMEHRLFDVTYSYEFIHSLLQAFPSLEAFINKKEQSEDVYTSNKAITGSPEMTKIVFDLLKCPYDEALRKLYFENKVNDLLFETLVKTFNNKPNKSKTSDKERDSLFIARDLILADITKHLTIKELSQKTNLKQYLDFGFNFLQNIDQFYVSVKPGIQLQTLSSIFSKKLVFEKNEYRTPEYREELSLILNTGKCFIGKKGGQNQENQILSSMVVPTGIEPVSKV